ncbi:AMP-binding protein [Tropicibacter oceani]|uniref:AMP-binding protein n=1 Tax=Tropicibacter oceani TaxID=3058420 RepID=A0ABY8QL18_9RHOB|nr:AMP-binding protein [Tropicibacter oceani]WGW04512.1 AMP-binding protein [Tropicibacter oceani]
MQGAADFLARIHAGFAGVSAPACLHDAGDLSFDQLHGRSSALAAELAGDRSPVMIRGHKHASYLVAYWACLLAGRPLIPIEPDLPVQRIRDAAAKAGVGLMLGAGTAALTDDPGVPQRDVTDFDESLPGFSPVPRAGRDTAYIMFSSGTSGQPKGIRVSYDNLAGFVDWLRGGLLPDVPLRAVTGNVRYCFDVSLFELWTSWLRRIPISVLDHGDFINSRKYIDRYAAHGAGLWISTPSAIQFYMRDKQFNGQNMPDLRLFLFCGEILPKHLVVDLRQRFPGARVINTYGPTECTVAVTSVEITDDHLVAERPLPIGAPRRGCSLVLEQGQITICGAPVGPGYVGLPDKQAAAFPAPNRYRTGDIGHQGADGLWYFQGRADREIKLQGIRIDLNEIEAQIRALQGVQAAVVDPHKLRGSYRALNAYVSGPDCADGLASLARRMATDLPAYMVPRFWFGCRDLQFNHNTKLDRGTFMAAAHAGDLRYVHD